MVTELLKYVFDESKKGGLKNVISAIIKIAASFLCLSPILVYLSLYYPVIINNINLFTTIIILGCCCLLFFIVFICSEIFAAMFLIKKMKVSNIMKDEEIAKYYYDKSFLITAIFQGILTLIIVINYLYRNSSILYSQNLNDLSKACFTLIGYMSICVGLWIFYLVKYARKVKKHTK